jgi:N-acetylmuramoyl-L-alanine amidase
LTEILFVSNKADAELLKTNSFLDKVAHGHVYGLVRFFGLKKKKVEDKPTTPKNPTLNPIGFEKYYKVQVGAFADIKNARGLEDDLIKKGHKPFIKKEGRLYKVQVGAFSEKQNAKDLMKKLSDQGYNSIVIYEE